MPSLTVAYSRMMRNNWLTFLQESAGNPDVAALKVVQAAATIGEPTLWQAVAGAAGEEMASEPFRAKVTKLKNYCLYVLETQCQANQNFGLSFEFGFGHMTSETQTTLEPYAAPFPKAHWEWAHLARLDFKSTEHRESDLPPRDAIDIAIRRAPELHFTYKGPLRDHYIQHEVASDFAIAYMVVMLDKLMSAYTWSNETDNVAVVVSDKEIFYSVGRIRKGLYTTDHHRIELC